MYLSSILRKQLSQYCEKFSQKSLFFLNNENLSTKKDDNKKKQLQLEDYTFHRHET